MTSRVQGRHAPARSPMTGAEQTWRPIPFLAVIAAAVTATQVKTWAEAVLQPAAEQLFPPTPQEKKLPGADPSGNPDAMPPTVLAKKAQAKAEAEAGEDAVPDEVADKVPPVLHWVMGVGLGLAYGVVARRFPAVRLGFGTVFGATAFAVTHATTLPALKLQAAPAQLPKAWWGWELGSHLVYGATVDTVIRLGDAIAASVDRH